MSKIQIPKEIFENIFLKNGGTKKNSLSTNMTGQYQFELDEKSPIEVNSEIEKDEFIKDSNGVRKAIGDTHEKGGIDVHLEEGSKVLSNHLRIGGDLARFIKKSYGLEIKASDTYAKVLNKYLKKIGLYKKADEFESLVKKLETQKREVEDEVTLALNQETLMNMINDIGKEIKPLEEEKEKMFDLLFDSQENSKTEAEAKNFMKNGGNFSELADKYGISLERAMEILPQYQDGGNIYSPTNPNNPLFAGQTSFPTQNGRVANIYEDPNKFIKQTEVGTGYFGDVVTYNSMEVQNEIKRLHPEIYNQFFKDGKIKPDNVKEFQKAIKNKYEKILVDAEKVYPKDSKELQDLKSNIAKDTFLTDDSVKGLEGKFGNFTSTRPNFALNVLPKDILTEVKNAGVNTSSELKNVFPDYYNKYVGNKDLKSDFWLGNIQEKTEVTPITASINEKVPVVTEEERVKRGLLLLPDQTPLRPPSMLAPSVEAPRVYSHEYMHISPNQQLAEFARNQQGIQKQIDQLPDAQRAATLASLDANNAANLSKVMSEATRYNAQADTQTAAAQAQAMTQQSALNSSANLQNQQLMGRELEGYDADLQNYYNRLSENNINSWKYINAINRSNAMSPNIQFTGDGYEVINVPEKRVPIAKKGGTFNKKKKKRF